MQFVNLTDLHIPPSIIEMVPESVARENVIIPLSQENGVLKIVVSDPSDFETISKLQFILNKDIQPVLAAKEQIVEAINRHYGQTETESVDSMLPEFTDTQIDFTETERTSQSHAEADESDAPVVKLVNLIIQEAISLRASDIHIEPFADRVRVRYRIDGVLVERDSPPRRLLAPLISRLKIMGSIDISEKRRPPGRPYQNERPRASTSTCASASCRPTTANRRDAYPRPRQHPGEHQRPRLRRGGLQALPEHHQTAQRHLPGHRARPGRARPPHFMPRSTS